MRFISGDTDPRLGKCKLEGGVPTPTHDELCYNHYYIDVALDSAWDTYTLNFKHFVQGTDGKPNDAIDSKEMYGLEFYFTTNVHFEIWVDDLEFTSK